MLKSTLLSVACTVVLAACATSGPIQSPSKVALAREAPPCLQQTGTRLPVKPQDCAAFGQTFTNRDLQGTGAVDTAGALQLLSPSLVIRGH